MGTPYFIQELMRMSFLEAVGIDLGLQGSECRRHSDGGKNESGVDGPWGRILSMREHIRAVRWEDSSGCAV